MRGANYRSFLLLAIVITGCSGGRDKSKELNLHAISGMVTLDGSPVSTGSLRLTPKPSTQPLRTISGIIDDSGTYMLTTYTDQDGAAAGEYEVSYSNIRQLDMDPGKLMESSDSPIAPLTITIPDHDTDDLAIELQSTPMTKAGSGTVGLGK